MQGSLIEKDVLGESIRRQTAPKSSELTCRRNLFESRPARDCPLQQKLMIVSYRVSRFERETEVVPRSLRFVLNMDEAFLFNPTPVVE